MRILTGSELDAAQPWLYAATEQGRLATCKRARCGSVIVLETGQKQILGCGSNNPPSANATRCHRKEELKLGFKSDRTCCTHAEQQAIFDALSKGNKALLPYSRLYYVRLDDQGNLKRSGKPYCTICSKMTLHVGIAEFALVHKEGLTVYSAEEYNDISFSYDA